MTAKLSSLGPREWDQGGPAQGGGLAQLLPLVILLLKAVAGDVAFLTGTRLFAWGQPHLSQPVEGGETVKYGRNSGSKACRKLNAGRVFCAQDAKRWRKEGPWDADVGGL